MAMQRITYWGNKREVSLMFSGVSQNFKYGETKTIDIPQGINLPAFFVTEDVLAKPVKKVDPVVVIPRKKGVK